KMTCHIKLPFPKKYSEKLILINRNYSVDWSFDGRQTPSPAVHRGKLPIGNATAGENSSAKGGMLVPNGTKN
ncbi:MAG: hypothetical protein LBG58_09170, partial [Planctomycetaceae bacterium]|nr:hypothetical protein [Planctomycetaceae bacterium]